MTNTPAVPADSIRTRVRVDFVLDDMLLLGYTLAYSFGFTGQALHEWVGAGLGLALTVHLTRHWDWVVHATRRVWRRGVRRRLLWAVNLALALSMTLCIASGFGLSETVLPALGLGRHGAAGTGLFWRRLHSLTATITLILVPVHAALDWRWVLSAVRRFHRRAVASEQP